ncbi:helix-turn-helix domain-containing protein [Dactylosporangium matsuzakiense]|uniref:helix-turn-helix domain-containing protein n=1 Tax=Dactylosporangium matsuzakiense TaxID=53360 RepID=UPI0031E68050
MGKRGVTAQRGKIRATRVEAGMSAATLAKRAQLSHGHLSNVERGVRAASPDVAGRIAAALTAARGEPVTICDLFAV